MYYTAHNNARQAHGRMPAVRLSGLVWLHPATTATHEIIWGKRVLAVPQDTSERPLERLS